jgi:hypothetical protein
MPHTCRGQEREAAGVRSGGPVLPSWLGGGGLPASGGKASRENKIDADKAGEREYT